MKNVTEADFRLPEFRDANPEDYEFRDDGKIVRKDRWKTGILSISTIMGFCGRKGFEINEVVDAVRNLEEARETIDAEMAGNLEIRKILGAREDETMFGLAERIAAELKQLRNQE